MYHYVKISINIKQSYTYKHGNRGVKIGFFAPAKMGQHFQVEIQLLTKYCHFTPNNKVYILLLEK